MPKIDAHAHVAQARSVDALAGLLARHAMRWLTICWYEGEESLRVQTAAAREVSARHPDRFEWIATFSLAGFGQPGWAERVRAAIDDARAAGAVGVKVWKTIGMGLRDAEGRFVMIDDPRFDPVMARVAAHGMTLAAHIGEPLDCWLPPEKMTVAGDREYFQSHPEFHAFLHPEIPGYREQIAARDRMVERNPGLRVVGCHLGSQEYSVADLAGTLDRHPLFAVDLAARVCHLQVQKSSDVRDFVIAHQDRLRYGTDAFWDPGGQEVGGKDARALAQEMERRYEQDYLYFAGNGMVDAPDVGPGFRCEALALPAPVLEKLYGLNARRWYPLLRPH